MGDWIKRLLNPQDATASTRSLMYVLVVLSGIVFLAVALAWQICAQLGLTANWVWAFGVLVGAVAGAKAYSAPGAGRADNDISPTRSSAEQ